MAIMSLTSTYEDSLLALEFSEESEKLPECLLRLLDDIDVTESEAANSLKDLDVNIVQVSTDSGDIQYGVRIGNSSTITHKEETFVKEDPSRERKVWNAIKGVPIINTGYGLVRSVVYLISGNKEESVRSIPRAIGGAAEVGVYAASATVVTAASIAASPVIVVVGATVAVIAAGSAISQVLGGGGEMIIDACTRKDYLTGNSDETEKRIYHKIVRDAAVVGALYSAGRAAVYAAKGNSDEARKSIKHAGFNAISSTVGVAAGVGLAKVASNAAPTVVKSVGSRWYSWSSVGSVFSSGLQKIGLKSAPKVVYIPPSAPTILKEAFIKIFMSPTTRSVVSSGSQQVVERMELCLAKALNSEDFRTLPVDPKWFRNCISTISGEQDVFCIQVKIEYALKCLIRSVLKLRGAVEDIMIDLDDQIVAEILSTGQVVLVQAVIALAFPNSSALSYGQLLNRVTDIGTRALMTYLITLGDIKTELTTAVDFPQSCASKYKYTPSVSRCHRPTLSLSPWVCTGKRVLCLDGGGIKGLVEIQILETIESFLKDSGNQNLVIKDCFDYIGGTSTGGLFALMLATGHTINDAKGLYFQLKNTVFSSCKPHDGEKFEKLLQACFGETAKMKDIEGIKVIITATSGSVDHLNLELFTNYCEKTQDELIWKVARRTCSAPGYFDPMQEDDGRRYYDGGLVANNPTKSVIRRIEGEVRNGVIISIGTGTFQDRGRPLPNVRNDLAGRLAMLFKGDLEELFKVFVNQVTKTDGEVVDEAIFLSELANCYYFRLTPILPEPIDLDETDNHKIMNMLFHAQAYSKENQNILREIAQLISSK